MKNPNISLLIGLTAFLMACGGGGSPTTTPTPTDTGTITGIIVESNRTSDTVAGDTVELTGTLTGTGNFDKTITWKLEPDSPGKLSAQVGNKVTYQAPISITANAKALVTATARGNKNVLKTFTINLNAAAAIRVYVKTANNPNDIGKAGRLRPTVDAEVTLTDTSGNKLTGRTNKAGEFTFVGVEPREYRASQITPDGYGTIVVGSDRLPLTAGQKFTDVTFVNSLSAITGQVFNDDDLDGVRKILVNNGEIVRDSNGDITYVETGVSTELIVTGTDVTGKAVNKRFSSDSNGKFALDGLLAGKYRVTEVQPEKMADWDDYSEIVGVTLTHNAQDRSDTTSEFDLGKGKVIGDLVFAEFVLPLTGEVFLDHDYDGYRLDYKNDIEDPKGIANVEIQLTGTTKTGASLTATAKTNDKGSFMFDRAVPSGEYTIKEIRPKGYGDGHFRVYRQSVLAPARGDSVKIDICIECALDRVPRLEFSDTLSMILGTVFLDDNKDNKFDLTEPGLVLNVPVKLVGIDVNGQSLSRTTQIGDFGTFGFDEVLAGTYTLKQDDPVLNYTAIGAQAGKVFDQFTEVELIGAQLGTTGVNQITDFIIPEGHNASGYNFGKTATK